MWECDGNVGVSHVDPRQRVDGENDLGTLREVFIICQTHGLKLKTRCQQNLPSPMS